MQLLYLPSAVLTVPPLLFNLVAFQTLSISAGAIEAARPPGNPESFLKLTNDVGVGSPEFDVGGCVVYSTSIFIRKSWAPLYAIANKNLIKTIDLRLGKEYEIFFWFDNYIWIFVIFYVVMFLCTSTVPLRSFIQFWDCVCSVSSGCTWWAVIFVSTAKNSKIWTKNSLNFSLPEN